MRAFFIRLRLYWYLMCLAFPVRVLAVEGGSALVELQGERRSVDVTMLSGLKAGDYVLAHGDLAIQRLDKKDAEETLKILNEISGCR